jgi:hypothetical protein
MQPSLVTLQKKQARLMRDVQDNLDFLIGSVSSQGKTGRFNLTTKVNAKTVSKYIPAGMEDKVRDKTLRHRKLKTLLKDLAEVNWQILKLQTDC